MTKEEVINKYKQYIMDTYTRYDLCLVKGQGINVQDISGKTYMDFISGISVVNLGYNNSKWLSAMQKQLTEITHSSNLFYIQPQVELAEILIKNSIKGKCFFCNSGAEANEAAIKIARKFAYEKGKKQSEIITLEQSFHGRTIATVTATGQKKYQEGFAPLLSGFVYTPLNNLEALKNKINDNTCAIMIELVQAEGGIKVADKNFVKNIASLCKKNNILLIIDEVQTGIGRCGDLFAYKLYDIEPDIFTLAKALGNGIPIGAMIARKEIAEVFKPGTHASTFGGNHLACTSALAVIDTILSEKLIKNAKQMGKYLSGRLNDLKEKYSFIKDIRGLGLLVGMEMSHPAHNIIEKCRDKGVILNCIQNTVIRFAPPLIVTKHDIDFMIKILNEVLIEEVLGGKNGT
ncbi:MAG: aspartate aminotransferase family protein [Candidatus Firestonebacteria bacterium]|nr:aspartate aminotransferase family protein [Candidatus Firestonebacteria bacterium]